MNVQQIEIIGRHRLVDELVGADVEVAMPLRDRGVDLIAYLDIDEQTDVQSPKRFAAVPIQMKAATERRFSLSTKYERLANLLLVYIWYVGTAKPVEIYAMTYSEALTIATARGWTKTASWNKGHYADTRVGAEVVELLQPYRMTRERWKPLIRKSGTAPAGPRPGTH